LKIERRRRYGQGAVAAVRARVRLVGRASAAASAVLIFRDRNPGEFVGVSALDPEGKESCLVSGCLGIAVNGDVDVGAPRLCNVTFSI
jgi:hypothetical protein